MDLDTERIELPDGGWWEIKKWLTRGDRKKVNRIERSWVKVREDMTPDEVAADPSSAIILDREAIDMDGMDDCLLIVGTVGWSYNGGFSIEEADQLKPEIVEKVISRMRELYLRPRGVIETETDLIKKDSP